MKIERETHKERNEHKKWTEEGKQKLEIKYTYEPNRTMNLSNKCIQTGAVEEGGHDQVPVLRLPNRVQSAHAGTFAVYGAMII